jgi:hypothetical protein
MRPTDSQSLTEKQRAEVLEQLACVLQSEYFRASRRCCHFLEYSVQYVLDGRSIEELKERVIGAEVFHKPVDYDTAQNNIVRVTANEVRKRLAQYYGSGSHGDGPTIHLQLGSYAACFRSARDNHPAPDTELNGSAPEAPPFEPHPVEVVRRSRIGWQVMVACMLAVASLAGVIVYRSQRSTDVVLGVWSPILQSPNTAVISIAQPHAYRITSSENDPQVPNGQFVKMPDAYVGVGDAFAMADVVKLLSGHGKDWQLIPSNATPSQTLFNGPIILIGNRSNRWSRDMLENQRFYFGFGDEICDRSNPKVKWKLQHLTPDWKTDEDFAIVSRFTNPASGQPVILIAGFTNYGTQAAGDFITNRGLLTEALSKAPKDWRQKNFQFVLHTKIIGNTPERPIVIASNFS